MTEALKLIGIEDESRIDKYSLRHENDVSVLKVYYKKDKDEYFARSEKFKFLRVKKEFRIDSGSGKSETVYEISDQLNDVVEALEKICVQDKKTTDVKKKILKDLRHLERVVASKISEIEEDLKSL
jgi:uncharacterized protein YxjI